MKKSFVVLVGLLVALFLVACAPKQAPSAPVAKAPVSIPQPIAPALAVTAPTKPAWQADWEKAVEAGKKDSRVAVYSSAAGKARTMIQDAFKTAYGIGVEWLSLGATQLGEKLMSERRAGLYNFDFYIGGTTTAMSVFKPAGAFEPIAPLLIFPDLTDPELIKKTWWKGQLPFTDKDRRFTVAYMGDAKNPMTINTDFVKPGEVKSYKDLLKPKFKGQVVIRDPTVRGGGSKWFAGSVVAGMVDEAYMRELAKLEPVISRDLRLQVEWVARGKYAVLFGAETVTVGEFMDMGAPITQLLPAEGTYVSASHGTLTYLNRAPHPNAARVFANWLLSKEGQTVAARGLMSESRRLDVPTDHLIPSQLRQAGASYFDAENEDFLLTEDKYQKLARDIFNIK